MKKNYEKSSGEEISAPRSGLKDHTPQISIDSDLLQHLLNIDKPTEENIKHAESVFESLLAYIEGHNWRTAIRVDAERLVGLDFSMYRAAFRVMIRVDDVAESITICTILPIACLKACYLLAEHELNQINMHLRYGGFRLDNDDGEITFHLAYSIAGQEFISELFDQYLDACLITSDANYPTIAKAATGALSSRKKETLLKQIRQLAEILSDS